MVLFLFLIFLLIWAGVAYLFCQFMVTPLIEAKGLEGTREFWTTFICGVVIALLYYGLHPNQGTYSPAENE